MIRIIVVKVMMIPSTMPDLLPRQSISVKVRSKPPAHSVGRHLQDETKCLCCGGVGIEDGHLQGGIPLPHHLQSFQFGIYQPRLFGVLSRKKHLQNVFGGTVITQRYIVALCM